MNVAPVQAFELPQASDGAPSRAPGHSFASALAAVIDDAATALDQADGKAGAMAVGAGSVVDASIARAKADVALDVVSVTASRVSGALNSLLQTQV
jgi:flagellar hook-basal body complex protein FliE